MALSHVVDDWMSGYDAGARQTPLGVARPLSARQSVRVSRRTNGRARVAPDSGLRGRICRPSRTTDVTPEPLSDFFSDA